MAQLIVQTAAIYLAVGLIFGVLFVAAGVQRLDPAAHGAPWTFRVLILPAVTALWPAMALRWWRAARARSQP